MDLAATLRRWPQEIGVDNGIEFNFEALDKWTYRRRVKLACEYLKDALIRLPT